MTKKETTMKKILLTAIILLIGCSSTNIITPTYVYERNEIEYSDLKTIEMQIEKYAMFYFNITTRVDGARFITFLGTAIDPVQLLHTEHPGYDAVVNPVIKKDEKIIIPNLYSKMKLTITARMANYVSK